MSSRAPDRPAFELLRFAAAPISDELAVVELDGRFGLGGGRFARRPLLVVAGARDLELTPLGSAAEDGRWWGTFAVPADVVADPGARFSLRVPGAVFELPDPDRPEDADRLVALAREVNRLRRALEVAEQEARTAREAVASAARANEEAVLEVRERLAAVEREAGERSRVERERRAELEARIAAREAAHAEELQARDAAASEQQDRYDAQRAEQRELRKQLRSARAELEALRRERAARPAVTPAPREDPTTPAPREDPTTLAPPEDPTTPAPPEDPTTLAAPESVRVIGRAPRAIDPVPAIPPEHAAPLDPVGPQPARWMALAALGAFLVVLVYLLFLS